ncbi:HARB1 nuclease, partial [Polyodon spathula]|nr:HARB1 nuclease [Polyodon spathula]
MHIYRLDIGTIAELCDLLSLESQTACSHTIPVPVTVTAALHFHATGAIQTTAGDRSCICQSSVSKILTDVTDALFHRERECIMYPIEDVEQNRTKHKLYQLSGFPNVLGVIDCTHIAIPPNRKYHRSLTVQVFCDAQSIIMDVVAKYPDSCHDSFIVESSALF